MNNNTREDLKAFIEAVVTLADAPSFASADTVAHVHAAAEKLKSQLDKDETILP